MALRHDDASELGLVPAATLTTVPIGRAPAGTLSVAAVVPVVLVTLVAVGVTVRGDRRRGRRRRSGRQRRRPLGRRRGGRSRLTRPRRRRSPPVAARPRGARGTGSPESPVATVVGGGTAASIAVAALVVEKGAESASGARKEARGLRADEKDAVRRPSGDVGIAEIFDRIPVTATGGLGDHEAGVVEVPAVSAVAVAWLASCRQSLRVIVSALVTPPGSAHS